MHILCDLNKRTHADPGGGLRGGAFGHIDSRYSHFSNMTSHCVLLVANGYTKGFKGVVVIFVF